MATLNNANSIATLLGREGKVPNEKICKTGSLTAHGVNTKLM